MRKSRMNSLLKTGFCFIFLLFSASGFSGNTRVSFDTVCEGLTRHSVTIGDFVQVKKSASINRELRSSGKFIICDYGIVWDTQKPFHSSMVVTQTKIAQTLPDGSRTVIDGSGNSVFSGIAGTLSSVFSGDRKRLEQSFHVQFLSTTNSWKMILLPKNQEVASAISSITLGGKGPCADSSISLDSILIDELNNDSILYTFKNQMYKEDLTDAEQTFFTF